MPNSKRRKSKAPVTRSITPSTDSVCYYVRIPPKVHYVLFHEPNVIKFPILACFYS